MRKDPTKKLLTCYILMEKVGGISLKELYEKMLSRAKSQKRQEE